MSTHRLFLGVFLITLAVYALTANGHLLGQDQEYYYRMARAVVLDHTFAIETPSPNSNGPASVSGAARRSYPQYQPGLPLALAPLVLLSRVLQGPMANLKSRYTWPSDDLADMSARFLVSYFNAPVVAATAALLALLVLRLGHSAKAAAFVGFVFAFATPAWAHARVIFPDPLQGLLLLLTVLFLLRGTRSGAIAGGACFALAMLVKLTSAFALPGLLLLPAARRQPLWRTPHLAALFLGPASGAVAVSVLYNLLRFRGGLAAGVLELIPQGVQVSNPAVGLAGLLLSPGKGIVWFAPPVLAALLVYDRLWTRRPREACALTVVVGVWLAGYTVLGSGAGVWDGGWGWGPRYLLPILPFALVALAECWQMPRGRMYVWALSLAGVAIQVPGATVNFVAAGAQAAVRFGRLCPGCSPAALAYWRDWVPAGSDLVTETQMLRSGKVDLAWITFGGTWVAWVTLLFVAVVAAAGIATLWQALYPTTSEPSIFWRQPGWPGNWKKYGPRPQLSGQEDEDSRTR